MQRTHDAVVIGGGVIGLATAWHLARLGARHGAGSVLLLEARRIGHDRGSSHGQSRITRSTYESEDLVRLATAAHAEEWPRLEHDAGAPLLHPTPGCFFGPQGAALEAYLSAVRIAGDSVEQLDVAEGRRRFPHFRFPDAACVLHDHTAALVAAADTVAALARVAAAAGVELREETPVLDLRSDDDAVHVQTASGIIRASRAVVCAGSWTSTLVPQLAPLLRVARQTVGYFRVDAPACSLTPPQFPVWAYLGPEALLYYGLPEFGRAGIKAARHAVTGRDDNADERRDPCPEELARIRTFLDEQLCSPVVAIEGAETCLYTATPTEDFVLDRLPEAPRITVGAGMSGHGFKFAPLTGRILAEVALSDSTTVEAFEIARGRFRFSRE